MAIAPTARAVWLAAACLAAGCFSDEGPPPLVGGTSSGDVDPSTSTAGGSTDVAPTTSTSSTTTSGDATVGETAGPACGDGEIDPDEDCDDGNVIDTDECRADCTQAACGDGVVWAGVEECDAGAANHPTLPDACRPGCVLPRCGDGAIYVGPLGPPITVGGGPGMTQLSDDGPRAIDSLADGTFRVLWRSDSNVDSVFVQALAADGQMTGVPTDLAAGQGFGDARDPVIAVASDGDYLVGWEIGGNAGDLRMRAVVDGAVQDGFSAHSSGVGEQQSISVGLSDAGTAAAAFLNAKDGGNVVALRFFPSVTAPGMAPFEQPISMHAGGLASTPTVAMLPTGAFLVAWGDPSGAIFYRRFTVDGMSGGLVKTALRVGGGAELPSTRPWTGAVLRPDGSAAIVGVDADGLLALQRFDAVDMPTGTVQVAESAARFVPMVDVASDSAGNLVVAWAACGAPQDVATSCSALPSVTSVRWLFADLTPFGPATTVTQKASGYPSPVGVAVAPNGSTAVTYVEDADVIVRMAVATCSS